ncbi:unnamed protein product [Gulo gulo]|uniref:Uncharacterized protein n=1 Tax=Gulo gulo TaxID=48420 RepID=A0A9X9LCH2_GULGU|nr:unnamed protein product [Gulo gulo]
MQDPSWSRICALIRPPSDLRVGADSLRNAGKEEDFPPSQDQGQYKVCGVDYQLVPDLVPENHGVTPLLIIIKRL